MVFCVSKACIAEKSVSAGPNSGGYYFGRVAAWRCQAEAVGAATTPAVKKGSFRAGGGSQASPEASREICVESIFSTGQ